MDRRESGSDHPICVPRGRAAATALSWLSTALPELWLHANSVLGQPRTIHRDWNLVQPSFRWTAVRTPVNPMRRGLDPHCRPNHLILLLYAYPKNAPVRRPAGDSDSGLHQNPLGSRGGPPRHAFDGAAAGDGCGPATGDRLAVSLAAVRYAWDNHLEGCDLYNAAGLPAAPFRTDRWPYEY